MKHAKIRLCLGLLAVLAIGAGMWLVSTYNLSTDYASDVPTATRTVKMCHNDCRYLAPGIAFLLNLGLGLSTAGGLSLVGLMMWHNMALAPAGDTDPEDLGWPYAAATAVIGVLHGAAFACLLAAFSARDKGQDSAPTAPSSGYVYDPSLHDTLSYAGAVHATLLHLVPPLLGAVGVCTLLVFALRSVRGARMRWMDRHDLPMMGFQALGAAIAAVVLLVLGPAIIDLLIDSPLGPD